MELFIKSMMHFGMEPDYFPNAINTKGFEKPIFDSNKNFISTTMYQFY